MIPPIGNTLVHLRAASTIAEVEATGLALIDELAFAIAGVEDADTILETCLRIERTVSDVCQHACPEMGAEQRAAAARRYTNEVQKRAMSLEARLPSVVSLAVH